MCDMELQEQDGLRLSGLKTETLRPKAETETRLENSKSGRILVTFAK